MKKVAILQSNYIPWKGYFDLIASVDEFIIYDDVQFTKNDWRNRNLIKTPNGCQWLTIPVGSNIKRNIKDVPLPNGNWKIKHLLTLEFNYAKSKFFNEIYSLIKSIYLCKNYSSLSEFNTTIIKTICEYLDINTKISFSWDFDLIEGKNDRLVSLCKQAEASVYLSGPSAKIYLDESKFKDENIELSWFNYDGYDVHPQLWGGFEHKVSILDLLFNCGKSTRNYMKA